MKRWLLALVVAGGIGCIALVWLAATFKTFYIPSGSMEPTLLVGDRLLASRSTFSARDPRRGELAIFSSPENPRILIINRVVGLPGETIEIRNKRVFIGGKPLDEPYAVHRDPTVALPNPFSPFPQRDNFGPLLIPAGRFFTMGDNRDNSYDSRFYGPVSRKSLRYGAPLIFYWSPDRGRIGNVLR